jgi:hypothetical protein
MSYIPDRLRSLVYQRAGGRCEYCLFEERYSIKAHEIDHIYAEKHGGKTAEDNLCLSCVFCNRFKGSDLASLDPQGGNPEFLFHPRLHIWSEHFVLNGARIEGLTSRGRTTVKFLQMSSDEQIEQREMLIQYGLYP